MSRVDLPRLERAMRMVARLIERDGDVYWPILERLEAERDGYLSRRERLKSYLRPKPTGKSSRSVSRSDTTNGAK